MSRPEINRAIYESRYSHDHLRIDTIRDPHERALVSMRLAYLGRFAPDRDVLDLGCGTGSYLVPAARVARRAYGVDFSAPLISTCRHRLREASLRADVALADVRELPFASESIDFAFSYTTLYYVPDVRRAVLEAARVLRSGGRFVAEFGNRFSLHTIVVGKSSTGVRSYHIPVGTMIRMLTSAGLAIEEHRSFQVLPMIGGRWYLRPLVTPLWRKVLGRTLHGVLVDEIVSSSPLLRRVAFRHVFSCVRR